MVGAHVIVGCAGSEQAATLTTPTTMPVVSERHLTMSREAEKRGLAEPFEGITTDGKVVTGLFPIRSTGVSTKPVRKATEAFLRSLTAEQREKTRFAVDDPEWRKWM